MHNALTRAAVECPKEILLEKIRTHTAVVGVVGLGYVGLPLAVEKAKLGFRVIGVDQNPVRVEKVNRGENYIHDVDEHDLRRFVSSGVLRAYGGFDLVPDMDVVVICVPTPLTRNLTPDLQYVERVTREVAKRVRVGQLISLESTTYPGTTEELMLPILCESGLVPDRDFFLVHSPERVDPGNKHYSTRNICKVVGGIGPASVEVAVAFYGQTVGRVITVSSSRVAELVKVFENTFRAVNIALVNELALLCDRMSLNVWEVLDAAFSKPFGIMPFYPGPGVGGHCVPVDPHYLEWKAKELNFNTHFIGLAGEINRGMPAFVRDKASRILNSMGIPPSRAKLLVLGVAYKRDVGDCRESPAIEVIRLLRQVGATVAYHDPWVPSFRDRELEMSSIPLTETTLSEADLVIITTDHSNVDYEWVVRHARHVFDTRNATREVSADRGKITLL